MQDKCSDCAGGNMITAHIGEDDYFEVFFDSDDLCNTCIFSSRCVFVMHLQEGNAILPKPITINKCQNYTNCNFE